MRYRNRDKAWQGQNKEGRKGKRKSKLMADRNKDLWNNYSYSQNTSIHIYTYIHMRTHTRTHAQKFPSPPTHTCTHTLPAHAHTNTQYFPQSKHIVRRKTGARGDGRDDQSVRIPNQFSHAGKKASGRASYGVCLLLSGRREPGLLREDLVYIRPGGSGAHRKG